MTCSIAALVCFGFAISFYYRGLPDKPQPAVGRIYPLDNHGLITYMTEREERQQRRGFIGFGVLFAVAMALVAIASAEFCLLKLWYLPRPNGDVQVACAVGIIISVMLAIIGRGMFHDHSGTQWPPSLSGTRHNLR